MKQERDSLATALSEVRHDTSRKMADMQQRFDHVYALMQDCQVQSCSMKLSQCSATTETSGQLSARTLATRQCLQFCRWVQNNTQNATRDECARLHAKLETLEQRQTAATQQASEATHTQSLQAKQIERSVEEHQHRLLTSMNKAESRGREAAEQIAQRAVTDSQTSMQVHGVLGMIASLLYSTCIMIAVIFALILQFLLPAAYTKLLSLCYKLLICVRQLMCEEFTPRLRSVSSHPSCNHVVSVGVV